MKKLFFQAVLCALPLAACPVFADGTRTYSCQVFSKESGSYLVGRALFIHKDENSVYTMGARVVYPGAKETIIDQAETSDRDYILVFRKAGYFARDTFGDNLIVIWNDRWVGYCR